MGPLKLSAIGYARLWLVSVAAKLNLSSVNNILSYPQWPGAPTMPSIDLRGILNFGFASSALSNDLISSDFS
jgi:hypothetical protein